ncbi:MAG: hypothetical protein Q8O76_00730, partial [Chloroflexota bacterium]|nr:hypothetical protein [Chloroflexota bacterium]
MSEVLCLNCGANLGGAEVCPKCGKTRALESYGLSIQQNRGGLILYKDGVAVEEVPSGEKRKALAQQLGVPYETLKAAILEAKTAPLPQRPASQQSDEPKIVESPGEGLVEQIEGKRYAIYHAGKVEIRNEHLTPDGKILRPLSKEVWAMPPEPKEAGETLDADIRAYIHDHVDFTNSNLYDLSTAYVRATWTLEKFNSVPYLRILGPVKSGKTRFMETLAKLCYRPILSANISVAALFRVIEAWRPTLFLDESETYMRKGKEDVLSLLNAGYRFGQVAIRVNMENPGNTIECFNVYGFKAIAGIEAFTPAIESRCIKIYMEKAARLLLRRLDEPRARDLRARLLGYRFKTLGEIGERGEIGEVNTGAGDAAKCGDARLAELFEPLLTTASPEGRAAVEACMSAAEEEEKTEEKTSVEAQVISAIIATYNGTTDRFTTDQITNTLNIGLSEGEAWKSRSVGKIVKRMGFSKILAGRERRAAYRFDKPLIIRIGHRYSVDLPETFFADPLTPVLTSPISPNPPISPPEEPKTESRGLKEDLERLLDVATRLKQSRGGEFTKELLSEVVFSTLFWT